MNITNITEVKEAGITLEIEKVVFIGDVGTMIRLKINDVVIIIDDDGESGAPIIYSTCDDVKTPTANELFNKAIDEIFNGDYWKFFDTALSYADYNQEKSDD